MKLIILENQNIKKHLIDCAIIDLNIMTVSFESLSDALEYAYNDDNPFILVSEIITSADLHLTEMNHVLTLAHFKGVIFLSKYGDDIIEMTRHISRSMNYHHVYGLSLPVTAEQFKEKLLRVMKHNNSPAVKKYVSPKLDIDILNYALAENLFVPYFQVQICSKTGKAIGFEILSRLHLDNRLYGPDSFIDTLIEHQCITEFTFIILKKTLSLLKAYPQFTEKLSLNIDYQSLIHYNFAKECIAIVEQMEFPLQQFTIEITENKPTISTYVMHNLTLFRMAGCQLSIDDFGTKSSGFTELLKFPFSEIKIDREFINDMLDSPRAYKVVKAICAVAHSLDCCVVAEGVETEEQSEILKKLEVSLLQGYLYSKPVPIDKAMALLTNFSIN